MEGTRFRLRRRGPALSRLLPRMGKIVTRADVSCFGNACV